LPFEIKMQDFISLKKYIGKNSSFKVTILSKASKTVVFFM